MEFTTACVKGDVMVWTEEAIWRKGWDVVRRKRREWNMKDRVLTLIVESLHVLA